MRNREGRRGSLVTIMVVGLVVADHPDAASACVTCFAMMPDAACFAGECGDGVFCWYSDWAVGAAPCSRVHLFETRLLNAELPERELWMLKPATIALAEDWLRSAACDPAGPREARTLLALGYMQAEKASFFGESAEDQIMARECDRWHRLCAELASTPREGQNISFGFERVSRFFSAWRQAAGRTRFSDAGVPTGPRPRAPNAPNATTPREGSRTSRSAAVESMSAIVM